MRVWVDGAGDVARELEMFSIERDVATYGDPVDGVVRRVPEDTWRASLFKREDCRRAWPSEILMRIPAPEDAPIHLEFKARLQWEDTCSVHYVGSVTKQRAA